MFGECLEFWTVFGRYLDDDWEVIGVCLDDV